MAGSGEEFVKALDTMVQNSGLPPGSEQPIDLKVWRLAKKLRELGILDPNDASKLEAKFPSLAERDVFIAKKQTKIRTMSMTDFNHLLRDTGIKDSHLKQEGQYFLSRYKAELALQTLQEANPEAEADNPNSHRQVDKNEAKNAAEVALNEEVKG